MMTSILSRDLVGDPADNPKRTAIVRAATRLFLASGFANVSVDSIAEAAGVSKPTVYSHFSGKAQLFAAVMSDLCERLVGGCPLGDRWSGPPEQVLTVIGRWIATLFTAPEAIALYRVVVAESQRVPELGRVFMEQGPKRINTALSAYLEEESGTGRLDVADPPVAAAQFMEMVSGPLQLPLLLGLSETPRPDTVDRVVNQAVTAFLAAYRTRP